MKYLHTRLLALCLCITLFFSSCGIYTAESSQQDFISSAENPETIQEAPLSTETPLSSSQMNIISSHNGIIASGMVGNKNGCYEVLYRPVGDGNILYTDYASKSRIYLSSRITGEHNNESDSSWLKSTVGGCYFSLTSEYLILFKLNTPAFADSETDMQRGYIAKYDLDGSNRQILTWLAPNETIADGCIASDSENLYYLNYFVQEDGNSSPLSLIQLNITSGEKNEIYQLSQNARHFIVGTYQDKIVIKNILNPITITEDLSSEDIVNAFKQQVHEIVLFSTDGQQQSLCQWHQGTRSEMYLDNKMFFWDKEQPGLYQYDLGSGSTVCLYSGAIISENGDTYTNITLSSDAFDNHILLTAIPDSTDVGKATRFAFDLEKNTFQTLTLSRNEYNVNILQEGFDYFLVQAGVKEYSVPDLAPDGQEITTNMLLPDVSLMIKSDYWNNIPNYIAINDDVL